MKKYVICLFTVMLGMLILAGCKRGLEPNAKIMAEGLVYTYTGEEISDEIDDSGILGTIVSSVDEDRIPAEDGQSNFENIGAGYAYCKDYLAVKVDKTWRKFEAEKSSEKVKLSLKKVRALSQKGMDLTWEDFEPFEGEVIGSGLYIMRYDMGEGYSLMVGSSGEELDYVRLCLGEREIDIRTEDVENFISQNKVA